MRAIVQATARFAQVPPCICQGTACVRNAARHRQDVQILQQRQTYGVYDPQQQPVRHFSPRFGACRIGYRRRQQGRSQLHRVGEVQLHFVAGRRGSRQEVVRDFAFGNSA